VSGVNAIKSTFLLDRWQWRPKLCHNPNCGLSSQAGYTHNFASTLHTHEQIRIIFSSMTFSSIFSTPRASFYCDLLRRLHSPAMPCLCCHAIHMGCGCYEFVARSDGRVTEENWHLETMLEQS
jgi:hypothetical protein